jgi:hypothetical protein
LRENPVVTFRTRWQVIKLLDNLAQLEGKSRSGIINKALWQYALDYLGARGHTPFADYVKTRLRMIETLQKRIEVNMLLKENRNLEEDRQKMLEETHLYARYAMNQASLLLLMKVSGWLAATLEDPPPADIEARTRELQALLNSLTKTRSDIAIQH